MVFVGALFILVYAVAPLPPPLDENRGVNAGGVWFSPEGSCVYHQYYSLMLFVHGLHYLGNNWLRGRVVAGMNLFKAVHIVNK